MQGMLYPDSWHFYGCGLLYKYIVVGCDLPCIVYVCVYNNKTFSYTSKSLFILTSLGST